MEVKLFTNHKAKRYIKKLFKNKLLHEEEYNIINRWDDETRDVKCYSLCEKDKIKNIVLLSKCDYDPEKKHSNPFILDYIYTFPEYRRNNLAYGMLLYIKKKEQVSAFCDSKESEKLFKKAEYIVTNCDSMMFGGSLFRFP